MMLQKKRRKLTISLISLAIVLCLAMGCFGIGNFANQEDADASLAWTTNNAVAFLNVGGSFLTELRGEQREYIYFGTNAPNSSTVNAVGYGNSKHTGAVRWKVLTTNDSKYGSGSNILLWSEYDLGISHYSLSKDNTNYGFWNTSYIRALLNDSDDKPYYYAGGSPVTSTQFSGVSYYEKLFKDYEQIGIASTNPSGYDTHDCVYSETRSSNSLATADYYTTGITSRYTAPSVLPTGSDTITIDTADTTVTEKSFGDKLFLLDYEDINTIAYGMYDLDTSNNKITYASKFGWGWSNWRNNYPSYSDKNGTYSNYLKGNDLVDRYWARTAVRYLSDAYAGANTLGASGSFYSNYVNHATYNGVRPALTLNPDNIIYATANTTALSGATFSQLNTTDTKPSYKLYLKDTTYSDSAANKPTLTKNGNVITATFSSTGATHAVALLSKRDATNHEVLYQADASIIGDTATFNLPSGLDISDYIVTLMTTSNNGAHSTETVYAKYTYDGVKATYYKVVSNVEVKFSVTASAPQEVEFGEDLYTPTPAEAPDSDHQFVGWTMEKDGSGEVFTTVIDELPWEAKLYAVWKIPDGRFTPTITPSGNTLTQTNNKASIEYGRDKVTLTASITSVAMSDIEFTCQWNKAGSPISGAKQKTYNKIENVSDNDNYSFDYEYYSKSEPLWRGSGTSTEMEVEITPGQLTVYELNLSGHAYSGRGTEEFDPLPVMKDTQGNVIDGVASWRIPGIVGEDSSIISNGKETRGFYFTPDSKYNGNYGGKALYSGDYEIEYLQITFKIMGEELYVDLEYDETYSYSRIATMFQNAFADYLDNEPTLAGSFEGRTPVFAWDDGSGVNDIPITTFKGITGDAYTHVKTPQEVEVKFVITNYTVTYKPDNDDADWTVTEVRYNRHLSKPTDPRNGSLLFMGWYYNTGEKDNLGNDIEAKWDFDDSRVTGDTILTAKWLTADRLESISVEIVGGKTFYALDEIKKGDLKVTATYIGVIAGEEIPQPMELDWDDYKDNIEYDTIYGDCLSIDGPGMTNVQVTVKFSYKGDEKEDSVTIPVKPKKIDVSSLDFGQGSGREIMMEADGTPKNLPDLDPSEYIPLGIASIDYEYYDSRNNPITPADVVNAGQYFVKVKFESSSYNYSADDLTLILRLGSFTDVTVVWDYDDIDPYMYNGKVQVPKAKVFRSNGTEITNITIQYTGDTNVSARGSYNITAVLGGSYRIIDGESCSFRIVKAVLDAPTLKDGMTITYDGAEKRFPDLFDYDTNLIKIEDGGSGTDAGSYTAILSLKDTSNCEWSSTSGATGNTVQVKWTIEKAHLTAKWDGDEHVSDGNVYMPKVVDFVGIASVDRNAVDYDNDITYEGDTSKSEVGAYSIKAVLNGATGWTNNYILDGNVDWAYAIIPQAGMQVVTIEWQNTVLVFNGKVQMPEYKVLDKDGNDITDEVKGMLTFGGDYDKSKWADDYSLTVNQPSSKYFIKSGLTCDYTISIDANGNGYNLNGDEKEGGGMSFDNVGEMLKQWWQVVASAVSIILIIIFTSKGISYTNKRKQAKSDKAKYAQYYAGATGLFGLAMTSWTIIACVLMGLAVVSFVFMLLQKASYSKAQRELDDAKEEFNRGEARQRDENMKMMFMSMFGGQGGNMGQGMAQGGYGLGADDIRGIVSETMTAMLPGVQQALPQQASRNDELVEKLIDQNERLMHQLAEQKTSERVVEREVAATTVNDETIKQMMRNQEKLMEKILELSADKGQPQIIEKEVPIEKIVEKVVEVPVEVEKIVEKEVKVEVPVEVEKIVEKEVIKEVKVEVPVEVEKIVEVEKEVIKEVKVEVPVVAPPKPKKEAAPKLTLDEAYALLSKEQKKYFDGLRDYAMSKYKCKEKKSTYFVTYGQTTTNPLLKLAIKKDTTVALLKMEDEFMKDLRRDASGDGTKVKVKETEIVVSDAQAFDTAKKMVDLREDQIERYQDLLKEQRASRK